MNLKNVFILIMVFFSFLKCNAAGVDDILNYNSPVKDYKNKTTPYTTQDIIKIIPFFLDDKNIFHEILFNKNDINLDAKFKAFDELNFGKCKILYITGNSYGSRIFHDTLEFLFPRNENVKSNASDLIKYKFKELKNPYGEFSKDDDCRDAQTEKLNKYNDIINAIIAASPDIRQARNRQASVAQKDNADQTVCYKNNLFKLHTLSNYLIQNRENAKSARKSIIEEQNAAKISGFIDKQKMYEWGQVVQISDSFIKNKFPEYKSLGGKALNIENIQTTSNPCPDKN